MIDTNGKTEKKIHKHIIVTWERKGSEKGKKMCEVESREKERKA